MPTDPSTQVAAPPAGGPSPWAGAPLGARVALALTLCLLWSALARWPFFDVVEIDDPFYITMSALWRLGQIPYRDIFDVKAPGFFAFEAGLQGLLGASLASLRGVEMLSDALAGFSLYSLGRSLGAPRAGVFAALLFPPLSVLAVCNAAYAPLLALTALAFAAALAPWPQTLRAAGAGLAIGAAITVKQTAAFEALALAGLFATTGPASARLRALAAFALAATAAPLAFLIYFAAHDALEPAIQATIFDALIRSHSKLENLTLLDGLARAPRKLLAIEPLLIGAVFALVNRETCLRRPAAASVAFGLWIGAAAGGFLIQRALISAYAGPLLAPTLLLSTLAIERLVATPRHRLLFGVVLAAAAIGFALRWPADHLDAREPREADARVAEIVRQQHPGPQDRLYVVNRGLWLYGLTGLAPPTRDLATLTTLCDLLPGGEDWLRAIFDGAPRFVVVADRSRRAVCELPERWALIDARLARDYREIGSAEDKFESYRIFERAAALP